MYEEKMLNLIEDMTIAVLTYSNLSNIANLGQKRINFRVSKGFKSMASAQISASVLCHPSYEDLYKYTCVHWEKGNYVVYFI